jgi:dihydropteroate synthase
VIPAAGQPRVVAPQDLDQVEGLYRRLGVSAAGVALMRRKAVFRMLELKDLDPRAAALLKQEMLSRGGEVALSGEGYELAGGPVECLVMGSLAQYDELIPKLRSLPHGLAALADSLEAALGHAEQPLPACHPGLDLRRRPLVMGILNVTPDSFSDAGDFFGAEVAVAAARRMVAEGAALIDIGGESTRPGSEPVSLEEELRRVVPVVRALAGEMPAHVSIDTYKAEVAAQALEAGAFMINDISAFRLDPGLADVARDAGCPVVIMHMQGEPRTMQDEPVYHDVVTEVYQFFVERLTWAVDRGIPEANLLIDPGIGFGKTLQHNLELLRHLDTFRSLGRPLLLGTSRKRFIGEILGLPEPKDRTVGTVASTVLGFTQGVDIVRVHDVKENAEAVRLARAIWASGV